jgi:succinyl-CoA:acetate CoA-transferase
MNGERVLNRELKGRITDAAAAAETIKDGCKVGVSGFTAAGCAKAVPRALAERIRRERESGRELRISVLSGASTDPGLDGALAAVDGIAFRSPFNTDPLVREKVNTGSIEFFDPHIGSLARIVRAGFLGDLDTAVIEVAGITEDGRLVPSMSVGNNQVFLDCAREVILEVNSSLPAELEGMHDIHEPLNPPDYPASRILSPSDRIGTPYLVCPPGKVRAVVETDRPDDMAELKEPDADSRAISRHILDFFRREVKEGRLPKSLYPLQSGFGNVANAVLYGLLDSEFGEMEVYTEVIQDGMLALIDAGKIRFASATALALAPSTMERFKADIGRYRGKVLLRPQSVSNHPGVIRRLGVIAMNGCVEFDIYGNVNSTHVNGTRMINGIGGSGDFARNSHLSIFTTPSVAKGGKISCVVPMVSHVDHCEHDVSVVVTEQGLADLRGCSPKQRAVRILERCVHPDYRPMLRDYYERALRDSSGKHTPHLLDEALSWHTRFLRTGSMRA